MMRVRGALASDRAKVSVTAAVTAAVPVSMALLTISGSLDAVRGHVLGNLARLWIAGLILGVVVVLVYAARGALIVRDPAAILENMARNRRLGLAAAPVAFVLVAVLAAGSPADTDLRLLVVAFLAGFLAPMMPVLLYIAFRIRPDEIFSKDPGVARAAVERLRSSDRKR